MPGCNERCLMDQSPSSDTIVRVEDISKRFGSLESLSHISITVKRGDIFGLVGSDGSGKSTLLRMVATMIRPSSGHIYVEGMDVVKGKSGIKRMIGYMPQRFGLYQDLTVQENLDFFMDIFGIFGPERTRRREKYLGFSNLLTFTERAAGALSGGMKQKLGLACVLVHEPKLLILDEPTNGVDPVSRQEFWDILIDMKKEGMTIMVSTAYMDEAEKCDQVALMHRSRVLDVATPESIRSEHKNMEDAMIKRIMDADEELLNDNFQI
ncbi:MAG: ABC transporter ATP-binding protein [Deltaproteobacteria bacterium]|nr:ABC transporter ATP-binding protein [Deltaproteobacteria bacterium]